MPDDHKRHPLFARSYVRVAELRFPDSRWATPATPHVSGVAVRDP